MEGRVQLCCAQSGRRERRLPDRHPAAVDDDGQPVGCDAHDHRQDARLIPVRPQPGDQQAERCRVERQSQRVGELDAVGDGGLGADAQRQRQEDQPDPAQSDVDQPADLPPTSRPAMSPKSRPRTITVARSCPVAPL